MTEARLPIHIKNNRAGEEVFRLTQQQYEAAAARHRAVASRVQATIDFDLDCFDESMTEAVGLVTWDLPTEALAERAPKLRWIHIIGAGVDHLQPLDWLPREVVLTNNRGVHANKAGEYGIMAILMLNNALPALLSAQQRHEFVENFTSSIENKTLLVLGAGEMGQAVARRAQHFGMSVLGIRRHPQATPGFDEVVGPEVLDEMLPHADFLLVTLPNTPSTRRILDARRLDLLKPGAGVINMGRAAVVDHEALAAGLSAGKIGGAVLDVFEPEPLPPSSPLWDVPNLVITPHVSSDDLVAYVPLTLDLVFENLGRLLDGRELKNQVDPELGY